ncbi:hypothetical protein NHX12_020651 [Muraenolepis orangiensis]|uniref:Uncharacterized protein n=1 Tax=Muraenolepis orangiensis TaxID=630683 RepID=A0A9Q0ES03_9TELE|nr:hypothetical protein NHX12_020651 [Muraenolepis orangiensis]
MLLCVCVAWLLWFCQHSAARPMSGVLQSHDTYLAAQDVSKQAQDVEAANANANDSSIRLISGKVQVSPDHHLDQGLKAENDGKKITFIFDPVLKIMSSLKAQHDKKLRVTGSGMVLRLRVTGSWLVLRLRVTGSWLVLRIRVTGSGMVLRPRVTGSWMVLSPRVTGSWMFRVEDPLVQKQALAEFQQVYHAATRSGMCNHTSPHALSDR